MIRRKKKGKLIIPCANDRFELTLGIFSLTPLSLLIDWNSVLKEVKKISEGCWSFGSNRKRED